LDLLLWTYGIPEYLGCNFVEPGKTVNLTNDSDTLQLELIELTK
jgi:hypothetical protein